MIEKKFICDKCSVIVPDGKNFWTMNRQKIQVKTEATLQHIWTDGISFYDPYDRACHLCQDCIIKVFEWVDSDDEL
jgi:hypothetical protein